MMSENSKRWHHIPPHVLAGAGAGITSAIITCPLDVVKIRIQGRIPLIDAGTFKWQATMPSLRHILATEGIRGWYRGLGTTLITYIPSMSVYFQAYNWSKLAWSKALSDRFWNVSPSHPIIHMLSAMSAGLVTNTATQPLWLVRTRLMSQTQNGHERRYKNTVQALKLILQKEGFHGLYKGLATSYFGLFHVVIQFPLYEKLKIMQSTNFAVVAF
jgi:solute carrier family 25 folate transporter 32